MCNLFQEDPSVPISTVHQVTRPPTNQWNRNKSISEANLLATDYGKSYHSIEHHPHLRDPRRNSVAEFGAHHDMVDHG